MGNLQDYEAAFQNAACFVQPEAGYLRLHGADRVDFLQRQTTNDLRQINPERALTTVLTSPTARILDLFLVIDEGESLGLITLASRSAETAQFLHSRIFFSDQVSLENLSLEYGQVLLLGPHSGDVLKTFDIQPPKLGVVTLGKLGEQSVTIMGQKILSDCDFRLIVPQPSQEQVLRTLSNAGLPVLSAQTFEILRVEAGQPGPMGELVADYTPLEVRLAEFVSDSKGCYTGQEIIARQITYDKVAKQLAGMKLSEAVETGSAIEVEGKSIGNLTSCVQSPRFGFIGLGIVRRPYHEVGTKLSIVGTHDIELTAIVSDLPFS